MGRITTFLISGAIVAWMAYLSWPVTADPPMSRDEVKRGIIAPAIEHYTTECHDDRPDTV